MFTWMSFRISRASLQLAAVVRCCRRHRSGAAGLNDGSPSLESSAPRATGRTLFCPAFAVGLVDIIGDEAHHALRVLRLGVGDRVRVADGAGSAASAQVISVSRQRLSLHVTEVHCVPASRLSLLTVTLAPPKGGRWDDAVRSLTELGVGAIQPLACERGFNVGTAPADVARTLRVATEALKQCRRGWLPTLLQPTTVVELAAAAADGSCIVCFGDLGGGQARPAQPPRRTILAIGPEGGFSPMERDALLSAGATPLRLASPVLRIETAAIAAAAVWATAWDAGA